VLSQYKGCFGYLLNILTGEEAGQNTGIPRPRTCGRLIGNNNLLVCRDAATEFYDIGGNRTVRLNSVRSGCTTSFIPAGGIVTAPMLAHGCVCNYPMFASLGLFHWPEIEQHRPVAVTKSWVNRMNGLAATAVPTRSGTVATDPFASTGGKTDIGKFRLINASMENAGSGFLLSTKDQNAGYAVRRADKPLEKATFTFAVKRAPGKGRYGNAFFVCGSSEKPEDWIECRLYYGGRRSITIAGSRVEKAEAKMGSIKTDVFAVTVSIDCKERTVTFEAGGARLTSKITESIDALTHYGCGGANSASLFTEILVR
jgi:hypothetical protein